VDNLTSISLNSFHGQALYTFTEWFNLKQVNYNYKSELYDGDDNLLYQGEMDFIGDAGYYTWSWVNVNKDTDAPGTWTFKVFLNDTLQVEATITVTD
jgi:hypothetical protein